jgi:hypothetical protein
MKYFVLAFLLACATAKKEEKKVEASDESDARMVSPYTVRPCQCMKIFMPVCAGGQNYGNSCEAECHGQKTWTDGPCSKKKK